MRKNRDTKEEEEERARQEFMRQQEERRRKEAEFQRRLCTMLQFPQFCDDARCKRSRRCAGDVEACFNNFWPHVPEDLKNEIRRTIELAAAGMAPAAVTRTQPPVISGPRIRSL